MGNVFFTSDLHLGHRGMLNFRNKSAIHFPKYFDDLDIMDDWIIEQWNKTVKKRDIVWLLGDVAWSLESLKKVERLKGTKRLVLGNHDSQIFKITDLVPYFSEIYGITKKYDLILSHVPIHPHELTLPGWHTNVHGHIHCSEKQKALDANKYINVNIDVMGATPVPLDVLRQAALRNKP